MVRLDIHRTVHLTVWLCLVYQLHSHDVLDTERYKAGKDKYQLLQRESSMPKYSVCWTSALHSLDVGCKHLTDDLQHRLALKFTNCFLKKTGRETYECEDTETLDVCTGDMKPEAYNTYTEFFTHTQNICYFLHAQSWQEETEFTIEKLSENSAVVAQQIEDSSELQMEVMKKQTESIKNQEILLERGQELRSTLEESKVDVHQMIAEFKDSTSEQRVLIFEVFDRLNSLQAVVLGEFTGFYSLIFYTVSILVSYLLTSTPRTSSARFWLFVTMTANIVLERFIVSYGSRDHYEDTVNGAVIDENSLVYQRLWLCRKIFTSVAFLIWIRCAYKYCDYNKINNELLREIRKQNSDLKHLLQRPLPSPPTPSKALEESLLNTAVACTDISRVETWNEAHKKRSLSVHQESNTTGYETDSDNSSGSSSSFNSTMTDRTFTVTCDLAQESESDTESFCTGMSFTSLKDELRDLLCATPVKELRKHSLTSKSSSCTVTPSNSGSSAKRGRPKGSKSKNTPTRSPAHSESSPCQYNLRSRSGMSLVTPNPVVNTETPEDFGQMVRHLTKVAQRNRVKAAVTLEHGHASTSRLAASSDEDFVH